MSANREQAHNGDRSEEARAVPDRRPYTVEGAAEFLACSPSHVRNLCHRGKLRWFPLGRLIRIPASAMEELECASSGSGEPSTPTGAKADNPSERRSELRIVKLRGQAPLGAIRAGFLDRGGY
jgi:excisionase family DNA binding protein